MIQFACDSCGTIKEPSDAWILGLAAEAVGVTSARKEVNILSGWDRPNAVHPLAVHFCSLECKDDYMARLFGPETAIETTVVKRTIPIEEGVVAKTSAGKRKTAHPSRKKKTA
ncbi:MAG: hypothetical protein ACRD2U_11755 [Terriglobales bacterium]